MATQDTHSPYTRSDSLESFSESGNKDVAHNVEKDEIDASTSSAHQLHGFKWTVVVIAILSTTFLFSLDTTTVANVQPSIIQHFHEISKLVWLGAGFALGSAATILPWSKAYGIVNTKYLYLAHVITFEAGSALCGGAPTMNALIVGRVIAGLGASGMYVGCLTYLSILTTVQERPLYMSLVGLVWGFGTVLGPVIGGAFVHSNATWRWAFYINLVIGGVFAPVYIFLLPEIDMLKGESYRQRIKHKVDWLGNLVFAGAMVAFILAINFGGTLYSWSDAREIVLWVVSGILFSGFAVTQYWHPLVSSRFTLYPVRFLKQFVLIALQTLAFLAAFTLLIPVYYVPLYCQFVKAQSALAAAVQLLPFVFMVVVFALLNGGLMAKLGYYWPWFLFGGACVLSGAALMHMVSPTTSLQQLRGYSALIGIGAGSFLQAPFSVTEALVPAEEVSDAVGLISVGQSVGIAVALGIAGAVFQNKAVDDITRIVPNVDTTILRQTLAGAQSNYLGTLSPANRTHVLQAIVHAMDDVYVLLIVAGGLVVVISLFLPVSRFFKSSFQTMLKKMTAEKKGRLFLTSD